MATPKRPSKKSSASAKATPTGLVNINLRLPEDLLAEIDQRVESANAAGRWPKVTRTDWMREALSQAVKPAK